jgi:hypothetical protein
LNDTEKYEFDVASDSIIPITNFIKIHSAVLELKQAGRQAGRQTNRQRDRQTDRQTGRQAGRQADRQT